MPPSQPPEVEKKFEQLIATLSEYGELINTQTPKFHSATMGTGTSGSKVPLTYYTINTEFEAGKAIITISVMKIGKTYYIQGFWFKSVNAFPTA